MKTIKEAISLESDLLLKLKPLPEAEIFKFMKNLRGGTYFNMGMYSSIPVSRAYKSTIRIYKVIDLTAVVSGVSYENIGTTKDFRDRTGEGPGKSWYDHTPGYENKIGQKKSDPNSKYVLWDIKRGTGTCVRYYVVDIDTGTVTPVSKEDVLTSDYLTATEKAKLTPKPVEGFDKTTGELVENKTNWRTAAFDHIFWLSQAGQATQEYGTRFEEDFNISEDVGSDLFMDAHAHVGTDLDAILSGEVTESVEKHLEEEADIFMDANAGAKTKLDDVLSGEGAKSVKMHEAASNKKYFYVVCTMYDEIVAHGIQIVDPAKLSAYETAEEFAMTEFFDGTGIAYSGEYEDDDGEFDWDNLTRYVGEIPAGDVSKYEHLSDAEAEELVNESGLNFIEEKLNKKLKNKNLKESYRRIIPRGASLVDNELFVDFD